MRYDSIEEIKRDIAKLDEQLEQVRAERAAKGLPVEYPADFVPPAIAWHLYERCEPVYQFTIKYANLCNRANEIIELSDDQVEWLLSFERYAELTSFVTGRSGIKILGSAYRGIIGALTNLSKYESVIELLRGLQINLSFITGDFSRPRLNSYIWGDDSEEYRSKVHREYKRLKEDEQAFDAELKRLNEHYESIEGELATWRN